MMLMIAQSPRSYLSCNGEASTLRPSSLPPLRSCSSGRRLAPASEVMPEMAEISVIPSSEASPMGCVVMIILIEPVGLAEPTCMMMPEDICWVIVLGEGLGQRSEQRFRSILPHERFHVIQVG